MMKKENAKDISLLIPTNGYEITHEAFTYGLDLAKELSLPICLLGIIENKAKEADVKNLILEEEKSVKKRDIPYTIKFDKGRGSVVIARYAQERNYITVISPLGRSIWRRVIQGRSFRRILEKIKTPIIYVPKYRFPIQRILLSMGGLGHASGVRNISAYLAKHFGAEITVLHVIEPTNLNYPTTEELFSDPENIVNTDTPQGKNLRETLKYVDELDVPVELVVRVGNIVHEIQKEVEENNYDLVGLGSHYDTHSLRNLYMPNVTAEIAESLGLPVVTTRSGFELLSV